MTRRGLAVLVTVLITVGCGPSSTEAEPFTGSWRSVGFGSYILIHNGAVEVFEYGRDHCVSVSQSGSRGIADVLSLEGDDVLLLREAGRIVRYERVASLPEVCADESFFEDDDAVRTFSIAATGIESHYSGALDADWATRRDALLATLGPDSTRSEAFAAVTALLDPLDDPQVRIAVADVQDGVPEGVWHSVVDPLTARLTEAAATGEYLVSVAGTRGTDAVVAGVAADGIGYLSLATLEPFADGVTKTGDEITGILDGLIETSTDTSSLIIDLRANDGGVEGLGMVVASRFVAVETLVGSREARVDGSDEYVEAGTIVVRPTPTGVFPGRVVVLIGPGTSGAAELLVMALRSVPGVVLVGEPTAGSPSPILARALPLGWVLGLPNQRTYDAAGVSFDGTGIPPDELVATIAADLDAGHDLALERAVAILQAGASSS